MARTLAGTGFDSVFLEEASNSTADVSLSVSAVVMLSTGDRLGGASGMLASSNFKFDLLGGSFASPCCRLPGFRRLA